MRLLERPGRWLIILPPLLFLTVFFLIPFAFAFKISLAETAPRVPPFTDILSRTSDGHLQKARSGIGLVVIKSEAPVVPVRVFGTFEAWGRGIRFPRPHHVAVNFGRPMEFAQLRAEAKTCSKARLKEIYQQVADEIMAAIAALEPREDN